MRSGIKWTFNTARFRVEFSIERERGVIYDGTDDDGEIQSKLDSGEYVAFDSAVKVYLDGDCIGEDYLGNSIYTDGQESEFWTAHRDSDPMNRNCSIMRRSRGENVAICHYFPGMVQQAIDDARDTINRRKAECAALPRLRK